MKEISEKEKHNDSKKATVERNNDAVKAPSSLAISNIDTLSVTDSISSPVVSKREHIPTLDDDSEGRDNGYNSKSEEESEESDDNLDDWKESREAIRSGVNRAASKEDILFSGKEASRITTARINKAGSKIVTESSGPSKTLFPPGPPELSVAAQVEKQSVPEAATVSLPPPPQPNSSGHPELQSVGTINTLEGVDEIDIFQDEEVPMLAVKVQSRSGSLLSGSRTMKATRPVGRNPPLKGNLTASSTLFENIIAP